MSRPLRKLGFLTIGLFDAGDTRRGNEATLTQIAIDLQEHALGVPGDPLA